MIFVKNISKLKILSFCIAYSSFHAAMPLPPQVIDNFMDTEGPINPNFGTKDTSFWHYHNHFIDSIGEKISVSRGSVRKFTLKPGNLSYDTTNNTTPGEFDYCFEGPSNMTLMPFLRLNFSKMTKAFTGSIILNSSSGENAEINNISFNPKNPNPVIDLFGAGEWSANGNFSGIESHIETIKKNIASIHNIKFIMNTDNISELEFNLTSIEAVPEPFSILTLTTGLTALVRKRKLKIRRLWVV